MLSAATGQLPGRTTAHSSTIYLDLAKSVIGDSIDSVLGSSSKTSAGEGPAMIYYTLDPQFGALLFSLYSRNERCSLFADPFASCSFPPSNGPDLLTHAQSALLQLLEIGQHYACFLSQVRAGSVVLLVGVGSLVCWRLWAHWRYRSDDDSSLDSPKPSPKTTPKKAEAGSSRRFGLLASLLEEELVQEAGEEEDEDPAFIQLLRLLKETLFDPQPGRYFGPDGSECKHGLQPVGLPVDVSSPFCKKRSERSQLLGTPPCDASSCSGSSAATPSEQLYHADHSSSASSRDKENVNSSSGGEESAAESRAAARSRRRRRRVCRTRDAERKTSESRADDTRDGDRNSIRDTESHKRCYFANPGSDDECSTDAARDDCEGVWNGAPYSDLLERMRSRQARRSLSREPSVCSNLSDILMSPNSSQCRLPFRREDSVCSNLSDFTVSECSELSMDVSVKEEVNNTFRHLEEIEQDLDDLKTSVLQMDEEVAQFVTKPDPYSLKMTFSDYSLSSKEDNDSFPHIHDESPGFENLKQESPRGKPLDGLLNVGSPTWSNKSLTVPGSLVVSKKNAIHVSDTEAVSSLEWDSPRHNSSSSTLPVLENGDTTFQKDEALVSLEWDDGGVKQHPEPTMPLRRVDSSHNFHDNVVVGSQLLPDHSSLELDLELELNNPVPHLPSIGPDQCRASAADFQLLSALPSSTDEIKLINAESKAQNTSLMTASTDSAIVTSMTASGMSSSTMSELTSSVTAIMEGSTDSAIYSAPGSRSATASPVPSSFLQPTLRYAAAAALSRRKKSRVFATLPAAASRPTSLQFSLHEVTSNATAGSGAGGVYAGVLNTPLRHSLCIPGALSPSVHTPPGSASAVSSLSFSHPSPLDLLTPESLEDYTLIERWLAGYPDFGASPNVGDSGVSNLRTKKNRNSCNDASQMKKSSDSYRSSKNSATSSGCRPCSQCAAVLNTVSALQGIHTALRISPCYEFPRPVGRTSPQPCNFARNSVPCKHRSCTQPSSRLNAS